MMKRYLQLWIMLILMTWVSSQEEQVVVDPCLQLSLQVAETVQLGQPLELILKLKNVCDQPLNIYLGGMPPYDFVVSNEAGKEVWRWSTDKAIQMILMALTLEPSQEHLFEDSWDLLDSSGQQLQAGEYTLQGFLKGEWPQLYQTLPAPLKILP